MKEETLQLITQKYKESWDYYEQLYANTLHSLKKMDKVLETYNLSTLSNEKTQNLNRLLTSKNINLVIKNQRKVQVLMASLIKSIEHLQTNECQSFSNSSKKVKRKYFQIYLCRASVALIPKPDKNTMRKKKL